MLLFGSFGNLYKLVMTNPVRLVRSAAESRHWALRVLSRDIGLTLEYSPARNPHVPYSLYLVPFQIRAEAHTEYSRTAEQQVDYAVA